MSGREKDLFGAAAAGRIGRREFAQKLTTLGVTVAAAQTMLLAARNEARAAPASTGRPTSGSASSCC